MRVVPGPSATYSARTVVRVVAGAVVVLSLVIGALLAVTVVQFASARNTLNDELNPARVELGSMLASYVDQETAERGYILTGRPEFLEPYDAADPQIADTLAKLRQQVSGEVYERVVEMDEAHQTWLDEAAEPELAAARSGDRARAVQLVASGEGKRLFDEVRTAHSAADRAIDVEQADANRRADALLRRLSLLLGFTIVVFLTTVLRGPVPSTACWSSPPATARRARPQQPGGRRR